MSMSGGRRNLAAECRAVEEGHRCRLDRDRGVFIVTSESRPGRHYELVAWGQGDLLVVSCVPCPTSARDQQPGVMACKHRALVARRLEREGLAKFDGQTWRVPSLGERYRDTMSAPRELTEDDEAKVAALLHRITGYESKGPRCPRCDELVDGEIVIPPERQSVTLNGVVWHRGCAGRAGDEHADQR